MTGLPQPPAHVQVYVDVLGLDLAIAFFLTFGGAELYLAAAPSQRSRLVQLIGEAKARELADAAGHLHRRVPMPKRWLAAVLRARGMPVAELARTFHVTDVTIRKWLGSSEAEAGRGGDARQMRLF